MTLIDATPLVDIGKLRAERDQALADVERLFAAISRLVRERDDARAAGREAVHALDAMRSGIVEVMATCQGASAAPAVSCSRPDDHKGAGR